MTTVILAGGLGTRLHDETVIGPEPMAEIDGKPARWRVAKETSSARRFVGNTFLIFGSSLSSSITGFILMAAVARHIGVKGFGMFSTVQIIVTSLAVLTDVGLSNIVVREVARHKDRSANVAGNILALKTCLAIATVPLTWLLAHYLGYDPETQRLTLIYGLALIPQSIGAACVAIFNGHEKMGYSTIVWLANTVAYAVGALVVLVGGSLEAVFATITLFTGVGAVTSLFVLRTHFGIKRLVLIDWSLWQKYLKDAYPYGLMAIFGMIGVAMGPLMLRSMGGEAQLGYFNCANRLVSILMMALTAYSFAVFPVFNRLHADSKQALSKAYGLSMKIMMVFGLPATVGLTLAAPLITLLFPGYEKAVPAFRLLVWYIFFAGLATPAQNVIYAQGRQMVCCVILGIAAVITVAVNIALIPRLQIAGACWGLIACTLTQFVLCYRQISTSHPISLWKLCIQAVALSAGLVCIVAIAGTNKWLMATIIPVGVVVLAMLAMRVFDPDEKNLLKQVPILRSFVR